MSEQNKALVRRLIEEVWSLGNFAVVGEVVARDYVGHSDTETHGAEGYKQFFVALRGAFPDLRVEIEDQIAERDRVLARWTARGTHEGELWGIPPTARQGLVTGISLFRVAEGQVAECWTEANYLGLMRQLGVLPSPGGSA